MDMMSPETFGFRECIDKEELNNNINKFICSYCKHYCNGSDCRVCKVSLVCQQIALSTIYQIPKEVE